MVDGLGEGERGHEMVVEMVDVKKIMRRGGRGEMR